MPTRKPFPQTAVTAVLIASRRRCALCYGLDGDTTEKEGQIAHVDRDASNVAEGNAAWLCTKHHSRYDARSQQTKGHTPKELVAYRGMLYEHMPRHPLGRMPAQVQLEVSVFRWKCSTGACLSIEPQSSSYAKSSRVAS
jgi:Rieske Fe-S protein